MMAASRGPFTAHPKIDPVTGEMVFFGYNAAGPLTPALSFGSINASGVVTRFDRFEAPYASMVHDFIVTEHHLLFPVLPITGSMARAMARPAALCLGAGQGRLCRRHEAPWLGRRHRLVPRRELLCLPRHECVGGRQPHRRRRHAVRGSPPVHPSRRLARPIPKKSRARLCRWTFDLAGNTDRFTQTYLDDLTGEFPRIDDRRAGLAEPPRLVRLRQS